MYIMHNAKSKSIVNGSVLFQTYSMCAHVPKQHICLFLY